MKKVKASALRRWPVIGLLALVQTICLTGGCDCRIAILARQQMGFSRVSTSGCVPAEPVRLRLPKRRRRQAPARGFAAVCSLHRSNRTEPQQPCPIRNGAGLRRFSERVPAEPVHLRFPKRRRRQAPARGLAAVCSLQRLNRTEPQQPGPIRDGAGLRRSPAAALSAGTAGTAGQRLQRRPELRVRFRVRGVVDYAGVGGERHFEIRRYALAVNGCA